MSYLIPELCFLSLLGHTISIPKLWLLKKYNRLKTKFFHIYQYKSSFTCLWKNNYSLCCYIDIIASFIKPILSFLRVLKNNIHFHNQQHQVPFYQYQLSLSAKDNMRNILRVSHILRLINIEIIEKYEKRVKYLSILLEVAV